MPNRYLETPAYELRRVRDDEADLPEFSVISHQMAVQPQVDLDAIAAEEKAAAAASAGGDDGRAEHAGSAAGTGAGRRCATAPAVAAAVVPQYGPRDGALVRLWRWLVGDKRAPEPQAATTPARGDADRHPSAIAIAIATVAGRATGVTGGRDGRRDERGRDEKRGAARRRASAGAQGRRAPPASRATSSVRNSAATSVEIAADGPTSSRRQGGPA